MPLFYKKIVCKSKILKKKNFTIQLYVPTIPVFVNVSIFALLNPKSINFAFPSEFNKILRNQNFRFEKKKKLLLGFQISMNDFRTK